MKTVAVSLFFLSMIGSMPSARCQTLRAALDKPIPRGARVFIAPVEGGFENYLAAAIQLKRVPVVVVTNRAKAEFEIRGWLKPKRRGGPKCFL